MIKFILAISLIFFLLTSSTYAPKTIVLDEIELTEIRFKKVEIISGDPPISEWKWQVEAQYRTLNSTGDSCDEKEIRILNDNQSLKFRELILPLINLIRNKEDIPEVTNFVDPPS